MGQCDYNCDSCKRTLCTQGNPTLEPTPEDLEELKQQEELFAQLTKAGPAALPDE